MIDLTPLHAQGQTFILNVDDYGSMGINNQGEVVYGKQVGDVLHPWVWLPQSLSTALPAGLTDLHTLAGHLGIARDINEDHQIAGQTGDTAGLSGRYYAEGDQACIWDLEAPTQGYFFLLDALDPNVTNDWSGANGINNDNPPVVVGQIASQFSVCGECTANPPPPQSDLSKHRGFKATFAGSQFPTLNLLAPSGAHYFNSSYAMGVSSAAQAGSVSIAGGSLCALKGAICGGSAGDCDQAALEATHWSPGAANLSVISLSTDASGRRMSDDGHVAGWGKDLSAGPTCVRHALFWESTTSAHTDLPLPTGQTGHACRAEGVNNDALPAVVGWDEEAGDAMLWEKQSNGTWAALNLSSNAAIGDATSRWIIKEAHDINDNGWIAAVAVDISVNPQVVHAVLLVPGGTCPNDVNFDGVVDVDDLIAVILGWGPCVAPPAACPADIDDDADVDVDDLIAVILGWGPCWTAAQEAAPDTVDECYLRAEQNYPDTSSEEFIEAYEACIESLCRRGLLNCD